MASPLRVIEKDCHSTNCFTGINFLLHILSVFPVWMALGQKLVMSALVPVFNDPQPLPECSGSNRWWPACKLLFLPCLHSGKVVGELFQLGQRAANGFYFPPPVNDPAERISFPSQAVMRSDGVRSPVWSQWVTSSFASAVSGLVTLSWSVTHFFKSRILW